LGTAVVIAGEPKCVIKHLDEIARYNNTCRALRLPCAAEDHLCREPSKGRSTILPPPLRLPIALARALPSINVATPVLTRPIELGADIVMHSATKYLNGRSDVIAGALVTALHDALWERIAAMRNRAAHESDLRDARNVKIADVLSAPAEKTLIFLRGSRRASNCCHHVV
jgi:hypothetical protein